MIWPFLLGVIIGAVLGCALTAIMASREKDPFDEETSTLWQYWHFQCPHCGIVTKNPNFQKSTNQTQNENKPNPGQ